MHADPSAEQAPLPEVGEASGQRPRTHLLTIALEDYFHVNAFHKLIQEGQWYRFESRLERNTSRALALLDRHGIRATFFVSGWVAKTAPEIVREVVGRGYEVACCGYYHRSIHQMTPAEFVEDLRRAREALERAAGVPVVGHRVAHGRVGPSDLWVLNALAREGFAYDSSLMPLFRAFREEPWRRFVHRHRSEGGEIWEFPISTIRLFGFDLPIGGGNYLRQFPPFLMRRAVASWDRRFEAPFVMYFHVWELDPSQPRITAAPLLTRIRHYRNLERYEAILSDYFARYRFIGIGEYLGLRGERRREEREERFDPLPWREEGIPVRREPASRPGLEERPGVTIVVPCYNEEQGLTYLANTLTRLEEELGGTYALHFVFVDDGSSDGTGAALERLFGGRPNHTILTHPANEGVAAAILTGIRHAPTEIVCSIDCDCTYDPLELRRMIPRLTEGIDLVTASPYHPEGRVANVPGWRLFLSRGASWLYRRVLRTPLHTYTSCFRVYRKSAIVRLDLHEKGFLGVAELIGKLDLSGGGVVEYPATLESRILGHSKMKLLRTVLGHLWMIARLWRLRRRKGRARVTEGVVEVEDRSPTADAT